MRKQDLFYFTPHLFPITILCGYAFNMPWTFLIIFLALIVFFTVLDFFVPRDETYSYEQVITTAENDGRLAPWGYEFATALFLLLHLTALGTGLYFVQFKEPFSVWILYSFLVAYSGINVLILCHEYFHHTNRIEKFVSRFFLSLLFSNTYENEHLFNHHDEHIICTEKDCSYARLNESVYQYAIKYITYATKSAVEVQKRICQHEGYSYYNIFKNTLLRWTLFSILLPILIFIFLGWKAILFYFIQAYLTIFLNLLGSYHQHYGLTRRLNKEGTPEPFNFMNTWASDCFFSDKLNFNMFHHGHHHLFSFCRYPYLKIVRLGPITPYGVNAIYFLSLIPSLWYKIMNPRVEEVFRLRDQYEKEGKL